MHVKICFLSAPHYGSSHNMTLQERQHTALFMGSSNIMPGQTMLFDYTFPSSMMGMGQHLEFACYQQGQNQVHMRLPFN